MNKKLWNSVYLEGLSIEMVYELIDHSYDLVVSKLTKALKSQLKELEEI
jgi:predicted DNA-binding protein (MmcQ/YjbR family)